MTDPPGPAAPSTPDPFARIRARPAKLVIGLISGTSADGVTGALAAITDRGGPRPEIVFRGWATIPYPAEVRRRLLDLFTGPQTIQEVAILHFTLGEPAVIAERTGRPVIADFRPADIAAGGVGAPFVPYADLLLLGGPTGRIALNLGGISNLTVLPAGAGRDDVYAFDCGPANMIMDGLVRHFTQGAETHDRDGARAARGRVRQDLLNELMRHPFVPAAPPKAAGHEQFGRPFLGRLLATWGALPSDDLIATATAFAGDAIALNIARFVVPRHAIDEVVASGGGVHNPTLMRRLASAVAPLRVRPIDEFGVPSDAKEALAFALLGHASLMGRPGNLPRVTGARHEAVLGKFTWPPGAGAPETAP